jgi:CubicO group peptidase (beta-lactamase class C family)
VLEPDASGTFVGSSFCYATARDWARFGLLYAQNGFWNNEQIITPEWIRRSTEPSPAAERGEYGFQWWLNSGPKADPAKRLFPGLPVDMYWADGFEGQNIFIIPSKKLVVVRLGLTRARSWGEEGLLEALVKAVK